MRTQAFGSFGVYGRESDDEREVLELAREYRARLCELYWQRHRAMVHLRDELFPDLFQAMVALEQVKAKIYSVEKEIKQHHSEVRDRNAVPVELEADLKDLRSQRAFRTQVMTAARQPWYDVAKAFTREMHSVCLHDDNPPLCVWKNVKSLSKRRELYEQLRLKMSGDTAAYADVWIASDIAFRELNQEFQSRGLHSSIRTEIVDATKPKRSKDSPGMRYEYSREPAPVPWEKITLQIPGGLTMQGAISGRCKSLVLKPVYCNHTSGGDDVVYQVDQQIGTAAIPRRIKYAVKLHRHFGKEAKIQRWTLVVRDGRRRVIPLLANHGLHKPTSEGVFAYDLTWRRHPGGIQVCHFVGTHVNESLVLPQWLLDRRLCVTCEQTETDLEANQLLAAKGYVPAGNLQGVAALESYCRDYQHDTAAVNALDDFHRRLSRATKEMQRAVRCIEDIYRVVTRRICSLHLSMVSDEIDLATIKRYDTRDLLRYDPLPSKSREYLQAVSPGKLRRLLDGYGLASVGALPDNMEVARNTAVFSGYVDGLGRKTGTKTSARNHRSQCATAGVVG